MRFMLRKKEKHPRVLSYSLCFKKSSLAAERTVAGQGSVARGKGEPSSRRQRPAEGPTPESLQRPPWGLWPIRSREPLTDTGESPCGQDR